MDRFADEIEYDLHVYCGLDLLDFFRGHYTWAKLFRLLNQLPWWSRYQLAIADDDEIAESQLEYEAEQEISDPSASSRPPLRQWDPMRELQTLIADGFNKLAVISAGSKKKPKPLPKPETGRDRAKRKRDMAAANDLFEEFTPGR